VGAVVHPWDVAVDVEGEPDPALNRLRAPIASVAPAGSSLRVRIGPLVAEVPAEDAGGLGLSPGRVVSATFAPEATRLVPLNGAGPAAPAPAP
jgi:hypothetical protein